jgi:hypothetical protein
MLISGHGYIETPKSLNQKMKNVNGFDGAAIRWSSVSQIYPQVNMKSFISCGNTDAPLAQIDASIAAGQPVIVMVDSTPAPGLLTHWVVLYAREGNDYLMLDPWPYQTDVNKKTYLMPRYSQGNPLQRSIMHVIIYEAFNASGGIQQPTDTTGQPQPTTSPVTLPANTPLARVKANLTYGLNIRSSIDTSSSSNIIIAVPAGTVLSLLGADDYSKIGAVNQWARVRDGAGHEGFAAAWYLEKVETTTPVSDTGSTPTVETGGTTTAPVASPLTVLVKPRVGRFGAKIYKTASSTSEVISTEKVRAKLTVLDNESDARAKIGKSGQWLHVKNKDGKIGYVYAELVGL